ncbi:hypothetical protein [Orbus hercynius]|nr:hypothetical protein [Orbus hercynius]
MMAEFCYMKFTGFSLLEILVVILMTSILSVGGISSWRDLRDRNELLTVTLALTSFLNEVKSDANRHNDNLTVYVIRSHSLPWCIAVSRHHRPADCQTKLRFIPDHKQVDLIGLTTDSALIFYGRHNSATPTSIRLSNRIGNSQIIISMPGRIRYCSYQTYLSGFSPC